jgi:hypothetical protein
MFDEARAFVLVIMRGMSTGSQMAPAGCNELPGGTNRELRADIERKLRPASAILVIARVHVTGREWVEEELILAQAYDEPIIGEM